MYLDIFSWFQLKNTERRLKWIKMLKTAKKSVSTSTQHPKAGQNTQQILDEIKLLLLLLIKWKFLNVSVIRIVAVNELCVNLWTQNTLKNYSYKNNKFSFVVFNLNYFETQLSINPMIFVFSVNLVCKKELNLMLKVSKTSSQAAVGFELRGTDYFLPRLYDLTNK